MGGIVGGGGGGGQNFGPFSSGTLTPPDPWNGQLPDLPPPPTAPAPVAPPPTAADPSIQASAAEALTAEIRRQRPLPQTILTSAMGDARPATTLKPRLGT